MAKRSLILTSVCAVLALASPSVSAGPDRATLDVAQADDAAQAGDAATRKRQKIRKRIRALRAWRLTEALDLDEVTASKLFPILNQYDDKFAKAMTQNRALRRQLRKLMRAEDAQQTAAKLNRLIEQMTAQQRKLWSLQEARFRDVRKVLTPRQAAKIFVVLPEIDRKLYRQIRRAAAKRGDAPGKQRKKRRKKRRQRGDSDLRDPFN